MRYSIALHIVGLVLWLGGLMMLTRILKVFCHQFPDEANAAMEGLRKVVKRLMFGFVVPGLLLTCVTGVYQITTMGMAYYMKEGWFHAKLSLVLILLVLTFLTLQEVMKANRKELLAPSRLIMLHVLSSLSLIVIVFLTMLSR